MRFWQHFGCKSRFFLYIFRSIFSKKFVKFRVGDKNFEKIGTHFTINLHNHKRNGKTLGYRQNTFESRMWVGGGEEGDGEENQLKLGGIGSTWRQLPTIKSKSKLQQNLKLWIAFFEKLGDNRSFYDKLA